MFVDASAIVAMMTDEADAASLGQRLQQSSDRATSALALWEAALAYSRTARIEPNAAFSAVKGYVEPLGIRTVAVDEQTSHWAIDAFERFGKGRHPAALNFGDCFAYACARQHGMPLLYKGDDFAKTDIEPA